jgi:hypothetical protein
VGIKNQTLKVLRLLTCKKKRMMKTMKRKKKKKMKRWTNQITGIMFSPYKKKPI